MPGQYSFGISAKILPQISLIIAPIMAFMPPSDKLPVYLSKVKTINAKILMGDRIIAIFKNKIAIFNKQSAVTIRLVNDSINFQSLSSSTLCLNSIRISPLEQ
jgi:hypothetical protein